jgi:hypothetical protein
MARGIYYLLAGVVKVNRHELNCLMTFSSHNPGVAIIIRGIRGIRGGGLFKRWKLIRLTLQPHLLQMTESAFAISAGIVTDQRVMIRRYNLSPIIALRKS